MKPTHNDIFRLVSLRGPERVFAVDPTDDVPDSEVIRLLRGVSVDSQQPDPNLARRLAKIRVLSKQDLDGSSIGAADTAVRRAAVETAKDLKAVQVAISGGDTVSLQDFAATRAFRRDYRALFDSWLKLILTDSKVDTIARHAEFIRTAHLVHLLARAPASINEPDAVRRLRRARVVPPRAWRSIGVREAKVRERNKVLLTAAKVVSTSDRAKRIVQAKAQLQDLLDRIDLTDRIQTKVHHTYFAWKRRQVAASQVQRPQRSRSGPTVRVRPQATPRLRLDATYFADLHTSLSPAERTLLTRILGPVNPDTLDGVLDALDPGRITNDANRVCRQIRLWEEEEVERLPTGTPGSASQERPLVSAIGWGELVVARERLIGYDAREIAHIENVMAGESKVREHERARTVEEVTEVETTRDTESERDLQTTERSEIQAESQTTIQQEFSTEAGVNTSGRYGLTKVETSLEVGFQQSKNEARSSSQELSREIVSRAVERTSQRVRELRRLTITERIRELNRHSLENLRQAGQAAPPDVSGIYLWVEKLLEVELRHYGTRMFVEFHIPEPALSLLERVNDRGERPRRPTAFTLSPADVHPGNYMCLAQVFGAQDIQPPPSQYIQVGFAWASAPSEDVNEDTAEDTVADTIAIPAGYRPVDGTAIVSPHPAQNRFFDVVMAVGGIVVVDWPGEDSPEERAREDDPKDRFHEGEIEFDPALSWPSGVPVSVRAHGHFDKTLVAQAALRCERTDEALANWRLRTWEQLRTAHERLMQEYRTELDEQAIRAPFGGPPLERPESENRRIEQEELRKWAIKAMRGVPFNFNAVEQVGDFQEVDPLNGDLQAAVARFFEEAFEWPQASYFFYPYYWSRRDTWKLRMGLGAIDARHAAFLRAGSARFIVPVTPGYEERVLFYLEPTPDDNELARLDGPPDDGPPLNTAFDNLWLELLLDRKPETALGSGTLSVQHGATAVTINDDSEWRATERDLGREVYIDGEQYSIARVVGPRQIELDEAYVGADDSDARYATGSVPYGPPWVVRVPTSLVVLNGRRPDLSQLGA